MVSALKSKPKWLIDTHGMKAALTTSSNKIRTAVIDAIECGEMLILKTVSDELKKMYPELWNDFKAIKNKKYEHVSVGVIHAAGALMESYGSSILGSVPGKEHFQAIAAARLLKCKLVSGDKGLANCERISSKCKLPNDSVVGLDAIV